MKRVCAWHKVLVAAAMLVAVVVPAGEGASVQRDVLPVEWSVTVEGGTLEVTLRALTAIDGFAASLQTSASPDGWRPLATSGEVDLAPGETVVLGVRGAHGGANLRLEARGSVAGERMVLQEILDLAGPAVQPSLGLDTSRWTEEDPVLLFAPSAGTTRIRLTVTGEDGTTQLEREYHRERFSDGALEVRWQATETKPLLVRAEAWAEDGTFVWEQLVPWSFDIVVDNIHFDSGSSSVPPTAAATLDAVATELSSVIGRVGQYVELNLYVAGYTDTVGSRQANLALSEARALSLAGALRQRGLEIPVLVRGFGQDVLAISTDDGVDEPANRRAIFVLAVEPPTGPRFPAGHWQRLR